MLSSPSIEPTLFPKIFGWDFHRLDITIQQAMYILVESMGGEVLMPEMTTDWYPGMLFHDQLDRHAVDFASDSEATVMWQRDLSEQLNNTQLRCACIHRSLCTSLSSEVLYEQVWDCIRHSVHRFEVFTYDAIKCDSRERKLRTNRAWTVEYR